MTIKVLYFGILRELTGRQEEQLDVPAGTTAHDLLRSVRAAQRSTSTVWNVLALAVNREYATQGTVLEDGDEVALLPPVSGGDA